MWSPSNAFLEPLKIEPSPSFILCTPFEKNPDALESLLPAAIAPLPTLVKALAIDLTESLAFNEEVLILSVTFCTLSSPELSTFNAPALKFALFIFDKFRLLA